MRFALIASLLACLALACPAGAQVATSSPLTVSNLNHEVEFQWVPTRHGDRMEPHSAIIIPVQIEGSPKTLYMQFDLGAPSTVLKKNMADSLAARLPGFAVVTEGGQSHVANLVFTLGEVRVEAPRVNIRNVGSSTGIAWDDPERIDVIGTIGADLLEGRVLVIDYPRARIFIGDAPPAGLAAPAQPLPFTFDQRRIILGEVRINGDPRRIMFDTGSSAFALLTNRDDWLALTGGGAGASSFGVNSWGATLTANVAPSPYEAHFGDTAIPLGAVAYIEGMGAAQSAGVSASGMGGMTGNKLFLEKVLLLDSRTLTYAVITPAN